MFCLRFESKRKKKKKNQNQNVKSTEKRRKKSAKKTGNLIQIGQLIATTWFKLDTQTHNDTHTHEVSRFLFLFSAFSVSANRSESNCVRWRDGPEPDRKKMIKNGWTWNLIGNRLKSRETKEKNSNPSEITTNNKRRSNIYAVAAVVVASSHFIVVVIVVVVHSYVLCVTQNLRRVCVCVSLS